MTDSDAASNRDALHGRPDAPAAPPGFDEHTILPAVLAELRACLEKVVPSSLRDAVEELSGARRVFLAAAGRSAMGIRGFAIRLMHMGRAVHVVGEATTPAIGEGDLLVVGSGSGRTPSLLTMAQTARRVGARLLLVTIDAGSPIAQLAHRVVVIPTSSPKVAGMEKLSLSIQPMGSLFEQALLILLDGLVMLLMAREGLSGERMFERHANLE